MPSTTPARAEKKNAEKKLLLVASTGGHLAQLVRLAPGLGASDDSVWVTFRSPQSESLLAGRRVLYVPYVRPRDWRGVLTVRRMVARLLELERFDRAVSTGAAIALSALPIARRYGVPTLYIESISRVEGPSLSGRLLAAAGGTEMRTQHPHWSGGRWGTHPAVLSTFHRVERPALERPSLFVTLGTIEGYRFDALVDAVLATGLADERTVWQLGFSAGRDDLPGRVFEQVPAADFERYSREADVVITHAGVGTILGLLEMGIHPLAVVRRAARGEHVDDHQAQIAQLISELRVGIGAEVDELDAERIRLAARYRIETDGLAAESLAEKRS